MAGSVGAAWTVVKGPDPADKTELSTHYAAEFARISRWMNKESIAVSLAGGGAYGLGHIGLLRRLQETGLPVDTVAGVSSGAVVAGMFTWRQDSVGPGKPSGLDELEKRHRQTLPIVLAAIVSMKPLERWLEAIKEFGLD